MTNSRPTYDHHTISGPRMTRRCSCRYVACRAIQILSLKTFTFHLLLTLVAPKMVRCDMLITQNVHTDLNSLQLLVSTSAYHNLWVNLTVLVVQQIKYENYH